MAITFTTLTENASTANATTYATASISPASSKTLIAAVTMAGIGAAVASTITGLSGTWTNITGSNRFNTSQDLAIFVCTNYTGSGTLTIGNTDSATHCIWAIFEVDGLDLTGPYRTGSSIKKVSPGSVSTVTITLDSALSSGNRPFAIYANNNTTAGQATPRTNWTELTDRGISTPGGVLQTQWRSGAFETTASVDWVAGPYTSAGVGIELIEAAATTPITGSDSFTLGESAALQIQWAVVDSATLSESTKKNFASLVDDFATEDTTKWANYGGANDPGVVGGQLSLTPPSGTTGSAAIESQYTNFSLVGSEFIIELAQVTTGNGSEVGINLYFGSNSLDFNYDVTSGIIRAGTFNAGTSTFTTVATETYNATNHRWLKFSESGGNVFWHRSADGISWTQFATFTTAFSVGSLGKAYLFAGNPGSAATPGTALLDNVNLPATVVPKSGTESATLTDTSSGSVTVSLSESATVSDSAVLQRSSEVSDSLALSEAVSISTTSSQADSVSFTELSSVQVVSVANDTISLSEVASLVVTINGTDSETFTDTASISAGNFIDSADSLTQSENTVSIANFSSISDGSTLIESVTIAATITGNDSEASTEIISLSNASNVTDTSTQSDTASINVSSALSESITLSENTSVNATLNVSDTDTLSDSSVLESGGNFSRVDDLTLSESVTISVITSANDTQSLSEQANAGSNDTRSGSDTASLSESALVTVSISTLDSMAIAESLSILASLSTTETSFQDDNTGTNYSSILSTQDSLNFNDESNVGQLLTLSALDSLLVIDSAELTITVGGPWPPIFGLPVVKANVITFGSESVTPGNANVTITEPGISVTGVIVRSPIEFEVKE